MKTMRRAVLLLILGLAGLALASDPVSGPQSRSNDLTNAVVMIPAFTNPVVILEPLSAIPRTGNFWSASMTLPPLPYDPYPQFTLYKEVENTNDIYVYDDRLVDYQALWANMAASWEQPSDKPGTGIRKELTGPPSFSDTNYGSSGSSSGPFVPSLAASSNYLTYSNFYLSIVQTNSGTNAVVSINGTRSNLTYQILTNGDVGLGLGAWGVWQTLTASNSVTFAPPIFCGSNALFFAAQWIDTSTNGIPAYWLMNYFGTLAVNPYADPDGDGLSTYSEFILGTNPTNAYSITTSHTDAQALFLAYTNDTTTYLWLSTSNGPGTNSVTVTMSNTYVGSNYQIYSRDTSSTNNPWRLETNFIGTNNIATKVVIALNGRTLVFIGGDGGDPDGDGLPSGYEVLATHTDPLLADTGQTGTPDGYKDPDGDGYSNLQEYQNGTDPLVFNAPAAVLSVAANFVSGTSGSVEFTWQPAGGSVLGYLIKEYVPGIGWTNVATNSASQLSYTDSLATAASDTADVQAIYTNGFSLDSGGMALTNDYSYQTPCVMVNGPGGVPCLVLQQILPNLAAIQVIMYYEDAAYPVDTYGNSQRYLQSINGYPSSGGNFSFSVSLSRFTNGVAQLTAAEVPPYADYGYEIVPVSQDGREGGAGPNGGYYYSLPFVDASEQMKQNVAFQMRLAATGPFEYSLYDTNGGQTDFSYPYCYAYSDFFFTDLYGATYNLVWNEFEPVEDNYFFRNLVFDPAHLQTDGYLNTGFEPEYYYSPDSYSVDLPLTFMFPTYSYVLNSNSAPIPALLYPSNTTWVGFHEGSQSGFTAGTSPWHGDTNIFGLVYDSLEVTNSWFYVQTAQPTLQTVDYYFARAGTDPTPGYMDGSFTTTNTTPSLIFGSVGQSQNIAGYAKQAVLNGYTNVFGYVGQYFTNALLMSNGTNTTNSAGIVSEYGQFFPMVPGHVALMTKPDPDQTNRQGTCEIDVIRLSLDVNHDGIMDETFTGPDNTSAQLPFTFWLNNDFDRWTTSILDVAPYEDDVANNDPAANSLYTGLPVPDYEYRDANGHRIIPCPRDLEDYARMWVSGISSNVLTNLPSGSTVTLSWAGIGTSPTIDLFQAADTNGGIGYLTNLTTASNQINTNLCQYVGRLGPGGRIQLNASTFSNNWAGNYFIWCGCAAGSDQLNLTIADGSGNVLAQSSQFIQIQDIKQMYERWTVGDNDDNVALPDVMPMSNAVPAQDDFSPSCPTQPFQYSYDPAIDTNDTYILYVHGWNEPRWRKDRWAETAYKRLYWQGYQGRFGEFRWPCFNLEITDPAGYDTSEWNAWKSGQSLETFLAKTLNKNYPNHVYLLAHSQGNVVAGEALRLATNQIVNTYVASQGAVSARGYDNTLATNAASYYTITTSDPQGNYYTNGAPSYFSASAGAGTYVNFYNPNDYALMGNSIIPFHPGWLKDQSLKPDAQENYHYSTPTASIPSGYYLGGTHYNRTGAPSPTNALYFPTNTYQIFAMGAQSYSLALGAQTGVTKLFNTNIQVNLNTSPYNFGSTHIQHDAEFTLDNMTTAAYWQQLLLSFGLNNQ